jgi:hypothetical protein
MSESERRCVTHHFACDCREELMAKTKAEAEKWEKLHDQDTEHLVALQKHDNYGPTETLNQTAVRLSRELAEARKQRDALAEALELSMGILAGLIDLNEDLYDLVVTATNKETGEENKMSVRKALENSIAILTAVKGGGA